MTDQTFQQRGQAVPATYLTRLMALAPAAAALWWWLTYPAYHLELAALAVAYMALLYVRPHWWIAVLPAVLPVLDLTMWTGRLFFTVFDFLVLLTLANLWARGRLGWSALLNRPSLAPIVASVIIGLIIGLSAAPSYEGLARFADYNSPDNALRVAKGFVWTLLLWMAWRATVTRDSDATTRGWSLLAAGIATGLIANGLGVFWERGVFDEVFHGGNLYSVATALLDMATAERATGLFSDMHVGGSALDGYLAITVPFALATAFAARSPGLRAVALIAVLFGGYSAAVSFSRGVLAGITVAGVVVAGLYLARQSSLQAGRRALAMAGVGAVIFLLVLLAMREVGGLQGQVALAMAPAILAAAMLPALSRWLRVAVATGMGGLLLAVIGDSMAESKWRTPLAGVELIVALVLTGAVIAAIAVIARRMTRRLGHGRSIVLLGLAGLLIGAVAFIAGSYRLEARLAESPEDLETRQSHWQQGLSLNDADLPSLLVGEGLGSYPRRYFDSLLGARSLPTYRVIGPEGGKRLVLGSGRFQFAQRVDLSGHSFPLDLAIRLETDEDRPKLNKSLCRRNIITQVHGGNACERGGVNPAPAREEGVFSARISGGRLGPDGFGKLPATLRIGNGADTARIIHDVSLTDARGEELLRNGSFEHGLDFWIFVSDFDHLPWHAKNLWLGLYVEQGLLGVAAYTLVLVLAIRRSLRCSRAGAWYGLALTGALIGFALTGIFTTLINVPRVAFLAAFLILLGLSETKQRDTPEAPEAGA